MRIRLSLRATTLSALGLVAAGLMAGSPSPASASVPVSAITPVLPAQGGSGTIKGRLVWGGAQVPQPEVAQAKGKASKDPEVCAASGDILKNDLVVDPKSKGVRYAIVWVVRPKGTNPEAEKALLGKEPQVEIDQKNCEFIPRNVAMMTKQPIVFKSSDAAGHNIHYTGFNNNKNFAMAPQGKAQEKLVKETRPIELKCDIHPWMKGYIMVLDHPFFAVTKEDGSFEIPGVPAGTQNVIVWQERVGYVTEGKNAGQPVQVKANEGADLGTITLDPANVKPR
jgi:hypothetical protein